MNVAQPAPVLFALPCGLSLGGVTTWAVRLANALDLPPEPLAMAVALSCSCAFLTPMASSAMTLVYEPGGYRPFDLLRAGLPAVAEGAYPLVLANILATPLKLLAPLLCGHVAPGGHLVLAGILARQADELKAAYAPWLALQVADSEDDWILMTARRPA